jgi:hypothetical protein
VVAAKKPEENKQPSMSALADLPSLGGNKPQVQSKGFDGSPDPDDFDLDDLPSDRG